MVRVLITGSRTWHDYTRFDKELVRFLSELDLAEEVLIVHGGATAGADFMAERFAIGNFIRTEVHLPDYETYGRAAPQIRNQQMVHLGARGCLAFIRPCRYPPSECKIRIPHGTHGASRTARLAEEAGIETRRFNDGWEEER